MNKLFFIIAITISLFSMQSCEHKSENCHSNIFVINKSTKIIFIEGGIWLPDTTSIWKESYFKFKDIFIVKPNDSTGIFSGGGCWENNFGTSELFPTGKTFIYVFDRDVTQTTSWDTIKAKKMYLKRYDLTLEDLQNTNWTITYP